MKRELTCIVCPMGCSLEVELDGNKVVGVTGNTCPRGAKYAEAECTNPQRTITTTMKCSDGSVIAVKTDTTIPRWDLSSIYTNFQSPDFENAMKKVSDGNNKLNGFTIGMSIPLWADINKVKSAKANAIASESKKKEFKEKH